MLSLPKLPLRFHTHAESNLVHAQYHLIEDSEDQEEDLLQSNTSPSCISSPQLKILLESNPCSPVCQKGKQTGEAEILCTPVSDRMPKDDELAMLVLDDQSDDLSPRLTNFIKSGVVPESPVNASGFIKIGVIPESPVNASGLFHDTLSHL